MPIAISLFMAATVLAVATPSTAEAKSRKLLPSAITDSPVVVGGAVLVPLADLAGAVSCDLTAPETKDQGYEAWPCRADGVLVFDAEAFASYVPTAPGTKQGFNPQPDPPRELHFGKLLVSRKVVMRSGEAFIALSEVAAMLGGKVKRSKKATWISVPSNAKGPLRLAAQKTSPATLPAKKTAPSSPTSPATKIAP